LEARAVNMPPMSDTPETDQEAAAPGDPAYAYKPSVMGAPHQFALRPDGLQWQIGRRSGLLLYDRIRRVRLSFRPATMQSQRFLTEIWSQDMPKLQIASASWRSMVELGRQDAAYSAFITELHRRLGAAGATAQFAAGMPMVVFGIGVLVFGSAMIAMAVLTVRAMQSGQWSAAAIIGALLAVFGFQLGSYFRRNVPSRYRPDAIPANVLPPRGKP